MQRRSNPFGVGIALLAVLALVWGAVSFKNGYWPFESRDGNPSGGVAAEHKVDASGGTYHFSDGIIVTVPRGAVGGTAELSVGTPRQSSAGGNVPLGGVNRASVAFDVSLAQGGKTGVQPLKPLGITVPLKGRMLPAGTKPSQALLYTGLGNGYMFVPTHVSGGVLTASLTHLSPKYITYVDEDNFAREFGIDGQSITRSQDCKSEVTANATGKVKFGSGNKGWSNSDKYSPINACLSAGSDGNPRVGIVNKRYYVLSVAASSGVSVESSRGDTDEELTKLFARTVFPNKKIAAFLGRDGRLVATTPSGSLPARIQFKADPNTFLAESGLFALKFTAGLLTGKSGNELTKSVNALFDSADVVDCLQTTLDVSQGKAFDFGFDDALKLVTSKCMSTIGQALGMPSNPWDLFGRWFATVGDGLSGGLQTVRTAYEGIRMQTVDGSPPVTVQVEQEATLRKFIGDWFVHGSQMTVNANGSGVLTWNAGPCGDVMCTGISSFKVTEYNGSSFTLLVLSEGYELPDGTTHHAPPGSELDLWHPGKSFTYDHVNSSLIKLRNVDDADGNPYMCRHDAPQEVMSLCGG